jgi:hypothetical protein
VAARGADGSQAWVDAGVDGAVAEIVRGDLGQAVQQLKAESGKGLLVGGLSKYIDLKFVSRLQPGSGAVALRYEPIRNQPHERDRR